MKTRFSRVTYKNMFLSHKPAFCIHAHYLIRICSVLDLERSERKIKINIEIYDGLFL